MCNVLSLLPKCICLVASISSEKRKCSFSLPRKMWDRFLISFPVSCSESFSEAHSSSGSSGGRLWASSPHVPCCLVACLGCLAYPGTTRPLWSTHGSMSLLCLMPFSASRSPPGRVQLHSTAHQSSVICSGLSLGLASRHISSPGSHTEASVGPRVLSSWFCSHYPPLPEISLPLLIAPLPLTCLYTHTDSTAWLDQRILIIE